MINIPSTIRISFRALKVNKMRSALTMLGIIIGVGAVIAMIAIGTGASRRSQSRSQAWEAIFSWYFPVQQPQAG